MSPDTVAHRILLGLGEEAEIRSPDDQEQRDHHLGPDALVVEYRHTDRAPDIFPAAGVTVATRGYGLTFPPPAEAQP